MKKWALFLMLVAILTAPALACGFPLPAGTSMTMVSKAVCAATEDSASCQVRQDAYQLMGKLQSAVVTDLKVDLVIDDGSTLTKAHMTGMYEYEVAGTDEGLGANVKAVMNAGAIETNGAVEAYNNLQFVLFGNKGYSSEDGGETWVYEDLDENAVLGLGLLLGLSGTSGTALDLFSQPATFSVMAGPDSVIDGQTMVVQTLTLDLAALLMDGEALGALLAEGAASGQDFGFDPSELGDPQELAMLAMFLIPAFEGSAFSVTFYIGTDDGYIHRIEEHYKFVMDASMIGLDAGSEDEAPAKMVMDYSVVGNISQFNQPLAIVPPDQAEPGQGFLGGGEGGLFGDEGGGLGGGLFGD